MKYLLLVFIFCLFTLESAFACGKFRTRFVLNKKTVTSFEKLCFENDRPSSENCIPLLNPKCAFSKLKPELSIKQFIGPVGSPGFGLCHRLGGSPQIYEVEIKKGEWKNFDRCFTPDKKDFTDIDMLVRHYP